MQNSIIVLLLSALAVDGGDTSSKSTALRSLVQAERTFARRCGEKGIRASFLEFFADDAIAFVPEPVKYKEAVKNLPPPDPHAISLEWEPQTGDVAASGDLGYTTGPSVRTDNAAPEKPKRYGVFFSVWRREGDGPWKVAADIGVSTPRQSTPLEAPFKLPRARPDKVTTRGTHLTNNETTIAALENEFSSSCGAEGALAGYLARVDDDTRLYRTNEMPIVGTAAIRLYLADLRAVPIWKPRASVISRAGDLGYAFGSYEFKNNAGDQSTIEKGFYLHVWKQTANNEWKLVADVTNPLEPEQH